VVSCFLRKPKPFEKRFLPYLAPKKLPLKPNARGTLSITKVFRFSFFFFLFPLSCVFDF
jgi:hypothetical protein